MYSQESKDSRIRQREKLDWDEAAVETSAVPPGKSGVGWPCRMILIEARAGGHMGYWMWGLPLARGLPLASGKSHRKAQL